MAEIGTKSRAVGHVAITNVRVTRIRQGAEDGRAAFDIRFDIGWARSWRDEPTADGRNNWDAAWVFIKYGSWDSRALSLGDADSQRIRQQLDRGQIAGLLDSWQGQAANTLMDAYGEPVQTEQWFGDRPELSAVRPGERWNVAQDRVIHGATGDEVVKERLVVEWVAQESALKVSRPRDLGHVRVTGVTATPPGAAVDLPGDRMGAFVYRSAENTGEGPVLFHQVGLRAELPDHANPDGMAVLLSGIEMVFIPEGPFQLGDPWGPGGPGNCFFDPAKHDGDKSYRVDSEEEIAVTREGGPGRRLFYRNDQTPYNAGDQQGPIPREYPKGYQAFYMMKRSITQGQYAAFVNTLQGGALTSRFSYWFGDYRYQITKNESGQRFALRPNRACNWLNWMDGIAYAAWAGLRPMTELEYEKACRGPVAPVHAEYAWGTTKLARSQVIFSDETGREATDGNCNIANTQYAFVGGDGGSGPLAEDAFGGGGEADVFPGSGIGLIMTGEHPLVASASWSDERERSGRSYYGVQSLSGNLWDFVVSVGFEEGRRFSGKHGTGELDRYGNPPIEQLAWPGADVRGVGGRGGAWYTPAGHGRVADRTMASGLALYIGRSHDMGFRCVRTAPPRRSDGRAV